MIARFLLVVVALSACTDTVGTGPRAPSPAWKADRVFGPRTPVPGEPDSAEAGPLRVVHFAPDRRDGRLVGLTVIFNLDLPTTLLAPPLEIEPEVPGRFERIGGRAFRFVASEAFPRASRFFVSVPAELRAADGRALDEEPLWSVATQRPALVDASAFVQGGGAVVRLAFNQPVDLEVLERKLAVVARRKPVPYRLVVDDLDRAVVHVVPRRSVPPRTVMTVTIQLGVQGLEGKVPSVQTERRTVAAAPRAQARRPDRAERAVAASKVAPAGGPKLRVRETFVRSSQSLPVDVPDGTRVDLRWWPATPGDLRAAHRGAVRIPGDAPRGQARVLAGPTLELDSLPEGVWIVSVSVSGERGWLVVERATLALDVWRDADSLLVRVTAVGGAGPVASARLNFLDASGRTLAAAATDADGLLRGAVPEGTALIRALLGRRRGFAALGLPLGPLTRGPAPTVFAPRHTVAPGQFVELRGTSRDTEVSIALLDVNGRSVEQVVPVNDGAYRWRWQVPSGSGPGSLEARVSDTRGTADLALEVPAADQALAELVLTPRDSTLRAGAVWKVDVRASGGGRPLGADAVRWRADEEGGVGSVRGEVVLDEAGTGEIAFRVPAVGREATWSLEAEVGTARASVSVSVIPQGPRLALVPSQRVLRLGERFTVGARAESPAGEFLPGWRGYVALERLEKDGYRRASLCRFDAPAAPIRCGFTPEAVGTYRLAFVAAPALLDVSAVDSAPGRLRAVLALVVVGPGYVPAPGVPQIWPDVGASTRVLLHPGGELVLPPGTGASPVDRLRTARGPWELFELKPEQLPTRVGVGTDWTVVGDSVDAPPLPVRVRVSPRAARPAGEIEVVVHTDPGARLEVLAVDGRVVARSRQIPGVLGAGDAAPPEYEGWREERVADATGRAVVKRALPPGVGRHGLVVFAHDGAGRSGQGVAFVEAMTPLDLVVDAPVEVGPWDTTHLTAWLRNRSSVRGTVLVQLGELERALELAPGQRGGVRFPVPPGGMDARVRAVPKWACSEDCPPEGGVEQQVRVLAAAPTGQRRVAVSRAAGASLRVVEVPDRARLQVRLSRDRMPARRMRDGGLGESLPWALRRAVLDTEAAGSLRRDVSPDDRAAALQWAGERLERRDVGREALAVCAVIIASDDPTRVRILADLEPLSAMSDLPVWARAWLGMAWARRLDRVRDKTQVERVFDGLTVEDDPVPAGQSGLGSRQLTDASVLLALLHSRPDDPRIESLVVRLHRYRRQGRATGPFAALVSELALRRLRNRSPTLGPPTPVEIWLDEAQVARVGLGGAEERLELSPSAGARSVTVAGPSDVAFWTELELLWDEPPGPVARGMSIERAISARRVRVGEIVEVTERLVVIAPRAWVRVRSTVPRGFSLAGGVAEVVHDRLEPGIYEHRYTLRARREGSWFFPPTVVVAIEQPWVRAVSTTAHLRVRPR